MSERDRRIDRRSLFDSIRHALRNDEPADTTRPVDAPAAFSIARFYAGRTADDAAARAFPRVTRRPGLAAVATTPTGKGPPPDSSKAPPPLPEGSS